MTNLGEDFIECHRCREPYFKYEKQAHDDECICNPANEGKNTSDLIPCETCNNNFSVEDYITHQMTCGGDGNDLMQDILMNLSNPIHRFRNPVPQMNFEYDQQSNPNLLNDNYNIDTDHRNIVKSDKYKDEIVGGQSYRSPTSSRQNTPIASPEHSIHYTSDVLGSEFITDTISGTDVSNLIKSRLMMLDNYLNDTGLSDIYPDTEPELTFITNEDRPYIKEISEHGHENENENEIKTEIETDTDTDTETEPKLEDKTKHDTVDNKNDNVMNFNGFIVKPLTPRTNFPYSRDRSPDDTISKLVQQQFSKDLNSASTFKRLFQYRSLTEQTPDELSNSVPEQPSEQPFNFCELPHAVSESHRIYLSSALERLGPIFGNSVNGNRPSSRRSLYGYPNSNGWYPNSGNYFYGSNYRTYSSPFLTGVDLSSIDLSTVPESMQKIVEHHINLEKNDTKFDNGKMKIG